MNIVLLGPPGAGKGTQGARIADRLAVPHISTGDLFRAMRRDNTALAVQIRSYMDRGMYVPDEITVQMVENRLMKEDARRGWILDGFPRTHAQAIALQDMLQRRRSRVDIAFHISAPTGVLLDRLAGRLVCSGCTAIYHVISKPPRREMVCDQCGDALQRRSDEDPEIVRQRLAVYAAQTEPIIDFYRAIGCLVEINGSLPLEVVERQVDEAVLSRVAISTVG